MSTTKQGRPSSDPGGKPEGESKVVTPEPFAPPTGDPGGSGTDLTKPRGTRPA
jgi:hypothetical protein